MAITREELKKLVLQEMQQNQVDEGVGDWLRNTRSKASSMLTKTGQIMTQAGEKVAPPPQLDDKTLRKVGDFLQMAQRDPELTKLILQTPFGKEVFGSDEKEKVTEALGQDFIKMIKDKKVTPQMLTGFIDAMKASPKAQKMMTGLGLVPKDSKPAQSTAEKPAEEPVAQQTQAGDVPVSDSDIESEEPVSTPEQDAAQAKPAEVPDVVSGTQVTTKKAKINFLPPAEEEPQVAQQIAKTSADKLGVLKKKFDSGSILNAKEKDELLRLLGALPPAKTKKPIAKPTTSKTKKQTTSSRGMQKSGGRLGESLQEAIVEEIFNLLTGKIK
jgi:hypothetical protein